MRRAADRIQDAKGASAVSLFDSSAAEPTELLRAVVEEGFRQPITSRYKSVFSESNSFVVDALSSRYSVGAERILCTTGATRGIQLLYRTFLGEGDHVVVETPGFDIFADFAKLFSAKVSKFERRGPLFQLDPEAVAKMLRPDTRLIILSNLHNPSGMLADDGALRALAEKAEAVGAHVIVDEVYRDFAVRNGRFETAAGVHPSIISINSLTKVFGLSALRCGWIIAEPGLISRVRRVSDRIEFGVSKLSHAAAALVLENSAPFERFVDDILARARPVMEASFAELEAEELISGRMPEHGCICYPQVIGASDTRSLSEWLAERHEVIVAPGEFFGSVGHIRIGFAHEPNLLRSGLARLSEGLRAYRARGLGKTTAA